MAQAEELKAKAEELIAQANVARDQEAAQAVIWIKERIAYLGLRAADIGLVSSRAPRGARSKAPKRGSRAAKYRGPDGQIWSGGRGRRPQWVTEALAQGRTLEEFAISR